MRIGLDITCIVPQSTGTGRFARYLFKTLLKLDKKNTYIAFARNKASNLRGLSIRRLKMPTNVLWHQFRLPMELKKSEVELFYSPTASIPFVKPCKSIMTIHDLAYMRFSEKFRFSDRIYMRALIELAIDKVDGIVTVSNFSKSEIIRFLTLEEHRIKVISPAADPQFKPINDPEHLCEVRKKYSLPEKFILFVGALEPRKNIVNLLLAYDAVRKKKAYTNVKLVIVGRKGWKYAEIFQIVKQFRMQDVLFTGYIPQEDLPAVYNLADVFVYPSFFEGFGMPPLEAMACGVPVITSNRSSLPEVVGDAALTINPYDHLELAEKIMQVLDDRDLAWHLIRSGLRRARNFTWEKAAKSLLSFFNEIVDES